MPLLPSGQLALFRPLIHPPPIAAQLLRDHSEGQSGRRQRLERVERLLVGLSELATDLRLERQAPRGEEPPFARDPRTDRQIDDRDQRRIIWASVRRYPHAQVRTVPRQVALDGLAQFWTRWNRSVVCRAEGAAVRAAFA